MEQCIPFFFFQAEDGIRYHCVTGVQTCALPISTSRTGSVWLPRRGGTNSPTPARTFIPRRTASRPMRPDEIHLAWFPFGDAAVRKLRPVLLLTGAVGPTPEVLVAYVSSVIPDALLPTNLLV